MWGHFALSLVVTFIVTYVAPRTLIYAFRAMEVLEILATEAHGRCERNTALVLALAKLKIAETPMEDMPMGLSPGDAA